MELAGEWATYTENGGFINCYSLNGAGLRFMDLTQEGWHVLQWVTLLLQNRALRLGSPVEKNGKKWLEEHFSVETGDADVITGWRADDSFFSYARAFLSNTINVRQLETALRLGDLGMQTMLKSRRAFESIIFTNALPAEGSVYYPKRVQRDRAAREAFYKMLETQEDGLYLQEIMRREMTLDELRIS